MARKALLPGQSRSTQCRTSSCGRLAGHHGEHRSTLKASPAVPAKAVLAEDLKVLKRLVDGGIVPASALPKGLLPAKAPAKARPATKSPQQCRISRKADGVRCSLRLGHKSLGAKHRFGTAVKVLPAADARRQVAASPKVTKRSRFIVSGRPADLSR